MTARYFRETIKDLIWANRGIVFSPNWYSPKEPFKKLEKKLEKLLQWFEKEVAPHCEGMSR